MWGLGFPELLVILVIALLVFGPSRLPEVGTFLGKSLRSFREALDQQEGDDDKRDKPESDKLPPGQAS